MGVGVAEGIAVAVGVGVAVGAMLGVGVGVGGGGVGDGGIPDWPGTMTVTNVIRFENANVAATDRRPASNRKLYKCPTASIRVGSAQSFVTNAVVPASHGPWGVAIARAPRSHRGASGVLSGA